MPTLCPPRRSRNLATRGESPRIWLYRLLGLVSMSTPANAHRSKDRSAAVLLRFSYEAREELKRRAHEQGMTVQQYADWKLLDFDPSKPIGGRAVGQRPLEGLSA